MVTILYIALHTPIADWPLWPGYKARQLCYGRFAIKKGPSLDLICNYLVDVCMQLPVQYMHTEGLGMRLLVS